MIVVSFSEYVPSPRFDQVAWTTIRIYESPLEAGPWTLIDTQALYPLDSDPAHPLPREITTDNGTIVNGWYRIDFVDNLSNVQPTDPIQNIKPMESEYLPSLPMVGLVSMGRTRDGSGNELGTFSSSTRPTDTSVLGIIRQAGTDVRDKIGGVIPSDLREKAKRVIAVRAAMLIELSYYSSEVATDRSPYPMLKELYEELLPDLITAIAAEESGENVDDSLTGSGTYAEFGFDSESTWMTRRM